MWWFCFTLSNDPSEPREIGNWNAFIDRSGSLFGSTFHFKRTVGTAADGPWMDQGRLLARRHLKIDHRSDWSRNSFVVALNDLFSLWFLGASADVSPGRGAREWSDTDGYDDGHEAFKLSRSVFAKKPLNWGTYLIAFVFPHRCLWSILEVQQQQQKLFCGNAGGCGVTTKAFRMEREWTAEENIHAICKPLWIRWIFRLLLLLHFYSWPTMMILNANSFT